MTDHAIADRRVESERQNCQATVESQCRMVRILIEQNVPINNIIMAVEALLYENYRRRS